MKDTRPKNLNLLTIRQPIPAIISILHRISGVVLFLLIPLMLWALGYSLQSQENFQDIHDMFTSTSGKTITLLCIAAFLYHFVAGIRHLLMDMEIGVELKSGRFTAMLTLVVSLLLTVLAGIYIW
ncbi:MAG: succinate dehydrogenase, cytochrome b556 subunit [Gammaproteobacteria bacterium]|nr:succinate dehydrogenase, cytochrome b556 subunit [Gammaproteobacteria bacterium]